MFTATNKQELTIHGLSETVFFYVKRVTYDSIYGQGVVYNVIVMDTSTQATSAYIPQATYACDFYSEQGCDIRSEVIDKLLSPVIGLAGLFLCFLDNTSLMQVSSTSHEPFIFFYLSRNRHLQLSDISLLWLLIVGFCY